MSRHPEPERDATNSVVLVDGSNVAYAIEGEPPRVANIIAIREKLREERFVSNDRFRDRIKQFPDAQDRVIRFMIVKDEVVFERRTRRRNEE